jgi:hypothetical protein
MNKTSCRGGSRLSWGTRKGEKEVTCAKITAQRRGRVVALGMTGSAQARPATVHGHGRGHVVVNHGARGVRTYHGHAGYHFTRHVWDAAHHRTVYFDPVYQCYFYWNTVTGCYVPAVDYCP